VGAGSDVLLLMYNRYAINLLYFLHLPKPFLEEVRPFDNAKGDRIITNYEWWIYNPYGIRVGVGSVVLLLMCNRYAIELLY